MDRSTLTAIVALAGVCLLLIVGLVAITIRMNRLQRRIVLLQGADEHDDFVTIVSGHVEATRRLDQHVAALDDHVLALRTALAGAIQRIGVVRYDAFGDMGGHLSFSAAFLDEHGTGVVMTCINSRTDARMYAKGVAGGGADDGILSDEEVAAIRLAMNPRQADHQLV